MADNIDAGIQPAGRELASTMVSKADQAAAIGTQSDIARTNAAVGRDQAALADPVCTVDRSRTDRKNTPPNTAALIEEMNAGYLPQPAELIPLLAGEADEALFSAADALTQARKGNVIFVRAILEFSNYCRCGCRYCGLNRENRLLHRYRMDEVEMIRTACEASAAGYRTIVLQSGEDPHYTCDMLCRIVSGIKAQCGIAITLSVGERPYDELKRLREAGADRYLLKHETSDPTLYAALHPGGSQAARIECLRQIKSLGYETGGGFMIGLPGQTLEIVARDLLLLHDLSCDMAGIGPFIAHDDTPLAGKPDGSPLLTRRAVAIARLLLPDANLPSTTSLGVLDGGERDAVFHSGANVIMRKVTPWTYRRLYEIYPADLGRELDIRAARENLDAYIRSLDREPL